MTVQVLTVATGLSAAGAVLVTRALDQLKKPDSTDAKAAFISGMAAATFTALACALNLPLSLWLIGTCTCIAAGQASMKWATLFLAVGFGGATGIHNEGMNIPLRSL